MWRQSFGLLGKSYTHDTTGSFLLGKWLYTSLYSVPLCSAVVDVAIQDYVADVASELTYQNKSPISTEVLFAFPLGPQMSIYSFQACSEDAKVQAMLQDEAQQLHEATGSWEDLEYLQDQSRYPGEVFACFLGTLSPGRELVVSLRYVQELPREPDGAARFVLPRTLHPYTELHAWNCLSSQLPYSLLLTASLQSPRGVVDVQANCSLTPLIYTAQDRSTAQVSLAGSPPGQCDLELLVYFGDPSAVSAVVEKGNPEAPPGSLLGDPMVLVTLAPSIPEAVPGQRQSGEFIFLLDTTFLEHAQDSLLFLLKSLPLGCYFNIYCYEAASVGIYPQSVEYTQDNVTEAMQLIPSTGSTPGDTNLLGTLRAVHGTPRPPGHARQLFIFMTGLPSDKEAIAAEVCRHRNSHRCFSFSFSEDSAALATALARETGGEATYVSSNNSMTAAVLQCLKRALKPAAEVVSLSWTLPRGLEVEVLGGTPQFIFQGQHRLLYAQIHGQAQDMTGAKGVMTLQCSLDGQDVTHRIEFQLCSQGDGRLAGHRLAARSLLQRLLPEAASGSGDEPRHRAVEISLASGIICPFTSYVGIRTSQRVPWYQGPLALLTPWQSHISCQIVELRGSCKDSSCYPVTVWVPPGWLTAVQESWRALRQLTCGITALPNRGACSKAYKPLPASVSSLKYVDPTAYVLCSPIFAPWSTEALAECQKLVVLQREDGSWALSSGLASVLEVSEAEIKRKMPGEVMEPSIWATVLAVTWLHRPDKCYQDYCELLEAKAVTWLCSQAGSQLDKCLEAANNLLGSSTQPSIFRL
ncbi:von Willebrand factor A domain-containing protein 5A-like isoform X2 [Myiozetetes cayanensis]|uniref:von Willebrand factor A domain-containing protein 5A-like isoform X2 n=1 Tax=Myiozetetes cayanensis TaxID=478635 RepID=UPI002160A314|nr:von Willebrand factor A domain-containing protein 5A-like isoform X2 [Myiozetetes cayanensis]XP_050183423.1 von Willebrand factor A domain-containing protein 5A-like isoform X2 [Myiozetetes cayanensis]